ncbi:YcdB/YcdC domain-containing protein [Paenibacillus daejeonensis]|uniref:YcdB/YcdC domain-containing protein n=1 Tax=Paenibacillus daejeonensis TaxID=135193 RepID=UPI0003A1B164|nr:YcdB/YcdC domain-containing protein [Paenibacillus daejeonensis]
MSRKQKRSTKALKVAVAGTLSLALLHGPIIPGVSAATGASGSATAVTVTDTTVPAPTPVSGTQAQGPDASQVKVTKEEAEKIARDLFPELAEAQLQEVNLGSPGTYPPPTELVWELRWQMTRGNGSYGYGIRIDALTGDVRSYSLPSFQEDWIVGYPPEVKRDQAEEIAKAFIVKVAPSLKDVELVEHQNSYISPRGGLFGQIGYALTYQVVVNGVLSEIESISVEVDGQGTVRGFHYNKLQSEYPQVTASVNAEEALESIQEGLKLQPVYQSSNYYYYGPRRGSEQWSLVYTPAEPLSVIDAVTGESIVSPYLSVGQTESLPAADRVFQPHQGAKLTAEQARARVTQVYTIPEGFVQEQSNLQTNSYESSKETWYLRWSKEYDPRNRYPFPESITATVEADTGKILRIYDESRMYYGYEQENEPAKITEAEARAEAIRLIHQLYPNAATELRMTSIGDSEAAEESGQFTYSFQRYYGDYPVQNASVGLTLDGEGKIIMYSSSAPSNEELAPKLDGLELTVSEAEAQETFIDALTTELAYISTGIFGYPGHEEAEIKLAYVPYVDGKRLGAYVDGTTGKLHTITFGEQTEIVEATDIEGHWAQEQLETLVSAGVLQPDAEGLLHPNAEVTLGDWIRMMARAMYGDYEMYGYYDDGGELFADIDADSPYVSAVRLFVNNGWLERKPTADLNPEQALTRDHLALLLTHVLSYDKLAGFMQQDVSVSGLADASAIDNKGAVAIVASLGLLQPSNGRFNPDGVVTKAQAATIIMRLAALQGKTDSTLFR